MDKQNIQQRLNKKQEEFNFSGSIQIRKAGETILSDAFGYANHSEDIPNQPDTRFSIASGSKIFTSIAICKLVEAGKLTFDTKIIDCLAIDFPYYDENITIHHLLTHTSGVPDYFDEDVMDDYESLWESLPMYRVRGAKDFLPLFQNEKMQDKVGSSFKYNNSGYIILGLIIEQIIGMEFANYIEKNIFEAVGMTESGYFSIDKLPDNVAVGHVEKLDDTWRTNIFSLPAKGGPDGGAYVTATDIEIFWDALMNGKLLSEEMTQILLTPQEQVADDIFYGYGGYLETSEQDVVKYIQMGYDPGVNYRSVYYPNLSLTIVVCSNKSEGAYEMLKEIENLTVSN